MADLVTIATTAALTQFVGPAFKYLGEQILERAKQVANTAVAQLKAVDREPQPVEPKILLPLVQAASLEADPVLIERWAALLANAADPAQRVTVQPGFVEVLRQLTPTDARVLEHIYQNQPDFSNSFLRPQSIEVAALIVLGVSVTETAMSVENLLRLRLGERRVGGFDNPSATTPMSASFDIVPTIYGQQFMRAVAPPTP
jgi:hypothetical protein